MKRILSVLVLMVFGLTFFSGVASSVDISGKSYINYKYDLTSGEVGNSEFSVDRVYLNFKHSITDTIKFRATTDIKAGTYGSNDSYYLVFMKYLHVTFEDVYKDASIRVGQINRPWVGFEEKIWEYRWVSKVLPDAEGLLSSTDRGVMLMGKIPGGYGEYNVAYLNGAGYHTSESGAYYKDISARITAQPLGTKNLKISGLVYSGNYDTGAITTRTRIMGLISYQIDKLTVAGEYLKSNTQGSPGVAVGGFALLKFIDKVTPFVRLESVDPDTGTATDDHLRLIVGVSYELDKKLSMAIDYQSVNYAAAGTTDTGIIYVHMRAKY